MFSTAVEDGKIRSNPVHGVRIPNGGSSTEFTEERAKALTLEELRLLLAALPDGWHLFFEFLAVTGLRISEAIGLRWEHLDLGEAPHVEVREQFYRGTRKRLKSRDGERNVPLSPAMSAGLLAHRRDTYKGPKTPVFASATGSELQPSNLRNRVLNRAAISVGLYMEVSGKDGKPRERSTVGFHIFRHTCASLLFAEGRNVKQVAEWLGHADPGFTLRTYVHLMDDGVGAGLDLDGGGGKRVATEGPEMAANAEPQASVETAA